MASTLGYMSLAPRSVEGPARPIHHVAAPERQAAARSDLNNRRKMSHATVFHRYAGSRAAFLTLRDCCC